VLDSALTLFRPSLQYNTAQRALEVCFPRLKMTLQATASNDDQGIMDSYMVGTNGVETIDTLVDLSLVNLR